MSPLLSEFNILVYYIISTHDLGCFFRITYPTNCGEIWLKHIILSVGLFGCYYHKRLKFLDVYRNGGRPDPTEFECADFEGKI